MGKKPAYQSPKVSRLDEEKSVYGGNGGEDCTPTGSGASRDCFTNGISAAASCMTGTGGEIMN